MYQLEIKNLTKKYEKPVLKDITFNAKKGEFISILGPSGCGKSTLLKIVAGLEKEDSGQIFIEGKKVNSLHPKDRNISMVFQNYALYPHMKVFDNIAIGLKLRKLRQQKIKERVQNIASLLKISDLLDRYPSQLSGGQQQRVALARAIVKNPSLFLLDEPLSNLDAQIREQTRSELKRLFNKIDATVIYVTHDQIEAMTMSDRIIVMSNGKIQQIGTPEEIYNNPENLFVARFVGNFRINVIKGVIDNNVFKKGNFSFPVHTDYTGAAYLAVRPEFIKISEHRNCTGKITFIENIGSQYIYTLGIDEGIELRFLSEKKLEIDQEVSVVIPEDKYYLFDSNGKRI